MMFLRLIPLLCCLLPYFGFAQCIIDAGLPGRLCSDDSTAQTLNASVVLGTAPYKVAWSYLYDPFRGIIKAYTASDYLNDTTIFNPTIRQIDPPNQVVFVKIEMEDSTGARCSDSVEVTYSQFAHNLDVTPKFVKEGDSIQLCVPSHFSGGFTPYQRYRWSVSSEISGSDTDDCIYTRPLYRADCYTVNGGYLGKVFTVIVKDAYGCNVSDGDAVALMTTGLPEKMGMMNPYCTFNNRSNTLYISSADNLKNGELQVYDDSGKKVFEQNIHGQSDISLNDELAETGIYIVRMISNGVLLANKKIYFERH